MNDQDRLIQRLRKWDEQALAEVFDTYAPAIYRYAYRLLGHRETAQDIAAETFQRFLSALKNGGGPQHNLPAWLYRVAHNLVVDYYRRGSQMEPLPLEDLTLSDMDTNEQTVLRGEKEARLREALWRLTEAQQQVIALRFLEGLSNEETARILGGTTGSVKALQHRAINSLRRLLEVEHE